MPEYPFGALVTQRMSALDLSTSDVLRRLDELGVEISRQAFWTWRVGQRRPSVAHLVVLLDVLQLHGSARAEAVNACGRTAEVGASSGGAA